MIKLDTVIPYLKKIQKICESRDTYPEFCWHQHFFTWNQQILFYQESRYRLYFGTQFLILLTFLVSLKNFLINLVIILMMSTKMATPGFLKVTIFWNKSYDVTNKILLSDLNYIVDVVMWPKFGNFRILWEKLSQPQFYKDLTRKTAFLRAGLGFNSITWDWH